MRSGSGVLGFVRRTPFLLPSCSSTHTRSHASTARENLKNLGGFHKRPRARNNDQSRIRNIGIMAHIDAGKTTTTERLLYFAGCTRSLGNVDSGDTVTDHMEQERERGITITSAAISLQWLGHQINLIDTPGHVDFTIEVERCLRVLDGAVGVLDAAAGVEAQTITVWRQAAHFGLPAIFFLNKMDKPGASMDMCLESIQKKLRIRPLPLFKDLRNSDGTLIGVEDLLHGQILEWPSGKEQDGRSYRKTKVVPEHPSYEGLRERREGVLGTLSELDEEFGATVLDSPDLHSICPETHIIPAIRFLPSPLDRADEVLERCYDQNLCGLAFKISHDKRQGPLTFFRGDHLYNVTQGVEEKGVKVFLPHSDQLEEIPNGGPGDILVLSGLKASVTGDTYTESKDAAKTAADHWAHIRHSHEHRPFLLEGIERPEAVFFCSVEAPSPSAQIRLDAALAELVREDPSLRVKYDEQSQQTIMEAMGELHIEIIKERLKREYGLEVFIGPLQINYREYVDGSGIAVVEKDERIGDERQRFTVELEVKPAPGKGRVERLRFHETKGETSLSGLRGDWLAAILRGVQSAFRYGPLLGYPVQDVEVVLRSATGKSRSSPAFIANVASAAAVKAMKEAGTGLLEPVMLVEIRCEAESESALLGELSGRRAEVEDVRLPGDEEWSERVIRARAPLAELGGLAGRVRGLSSGRASLHLQLQGYVRMLANDQEALIRRLSGHSD